MRRVVLYSLLWALSLSSAVAEQKHLGSFGDWDSWMDINKRNRLCYVVSQPSNSEGKYNKRGKIYLMVARWPKKTERNEVSFFAGYEFKQDAIPTLTVDDNNVFYLFAQGEWSWAKDHEKDVELIRRFIKGRQAVMRGVSWRGTETVDYFSLRGFTSAWAEVNKNCP